MNPDDQPRHPPSDHNNGDSDTESEFPPDSSFADSDYSTSKNEETDISDTDTASMTSEESDSPAHPGTEAIGLAAAGTADPTGAAPATPVAAFRDVNNSQRWHTLDRVLQEWPDEGNPPPSRTPWGDDR